ncbi:hypothetical protein LX99_02964 [Mucilaginibacter oryzae]|uniref:Uncharacterized protein n=2 Tax=Mucilaginibacter oryzae TaxID=468058 RepID=A0A316H844_9SPHI|nr:hypothetical protein LX99_02964 [Mucilaginibacter oryzae]
MKSLKTCKKMNRTLTKWVIDLHGKGYTDDFLQLNSQRLRCLQNSEDFPITDLDIKVIHQGFDQLTKTYKYIHTIETMDGAKGLLVVEDVCPNYLPN